MLFFQPIIVKIVLCVLYILRYYVGERVHIGDHRLTEMNLSLCQCTYLTPLGSTLFICEVCFEACSGNVVSCCSDSALVISSFLQFYSSQEHREPRALLKQKKQMEGCK